MITLVGLNHRTATIEIREKFSFSPEEIIEFKNFIQKHVEIKGLVVVSTCNRTEIYTDFTGISEKNAFDLIFDNLMKFKNIDKDLSNYFYKKSNAEVINHLFRVVAGLDSMILGEYQIVGQLKTAVAVSDQNNFSGKCLTRLFQKAFETGKLIRTKTKINEGAVSVSYAAVETAVKKFPDLRNRNILAVGAGETGQIAVSGLIKKNCRNITVINRNYEKAEILAKKYDIKLDNFSNLAQNLITNDAVIVATSSKQPIILEHQINSVMLARDFKPLLLIDLSVPANIQNTVKNIKNVTLLTVDDMQAVINETYSKRKSEIKDAEQIINEKAAEFLEWISTGQLTNTFLKVSQKFKEIHAAEIEGFQKNKFSDGYLKAEEYGEHITNKYIRMLIKNIKTVTENGKNVENIKLVNQLFDF